MTPEEFVQIANDHRRHESGGKAQARIEARRERIGAARRNGQSTRDIAKEEGVSQKTVRNDLELSTPTHLPPVIKGSDGKTYPAKVLCARCKRVAPGVGIKGCESCADERKERAGSTKKTTSKAE